IARNQIAKGIKAINVERCRLWWSVTQKEATCIISATGTWRGWLVYYINKAALWRGGLPHPETGLPKLSANLPLPPSGILWVVPLGVSARVRVHIGVSQGKRTVPSTAHEMLKFPMKGGVVTLRSNTMMSAGCNMIAGTSKEPSPHEPAAAEGIKVAIHLEYPEQTIIIGGSLSEKRRMELCNLLKENLDVFTWKPSDMTGVPRPIVEHRLNIRKGCPPIWQKRRGQAPDRNKAIQEEVFKLIETQIMREVHYHSWLSNSVMRLTEKTNPSADTLSNAFSMPIRDTTKYEWQRKMKKRQLSTQVKGSFATQRCLLVSKMPERHTNSSWTKLLKINVKGIKACPDKAEAVIRLPSPKTLKEWTPEAKKAFQAMKQCIAKRPMVTAPKPKEELIIYLCAAREEISAVLLTERDLQ
ncbi:reverse transcriptase domain-containing protein, partial [Tanacetum coccineum]